MPAPMISLQPLAANSRDPEERYEVHDLNGHRRILPNLEKAARWVEQGCPDYDPTYRAEKHLTAWVRADTPTGRRPRFQWLIICNDTEQRIGAFPEDEEDRAKAWAAAGCRKTNNPLTWDSWYKDKIRADKVQPGDLIVSPWGDRQAVLEVEETHHDVFTSPEGKTGPRVRFTGWATLPGVIEAQRVELGWAQEARGHMYLMGDLRDVKSYE